MIEGRGRVQKGEESCGELMKSLRKVAESCGELPKLVGKLRNNCEKERKVAEGYCKVILRTLATPAAFGFCYFDCCRLYSVHISHIRNGMCSVGQGIERLLLTDLKKP